MYRYQNRGQGYRRALLDLISNINDGEAVLHSDVTTRTIIPDIAGPREDQQGLWEGQQRIVQAVPLDTRYNSIAVQVTLLAAGFLIGPNGSVIKQIWQTTDASIRSFSNKKRYGDGQLSVREFRIQGTHKQIFRTLSIFVKAVDLLLDLLSGQYSDKVVSAHQYVEGIRFEYKPPPIVANPFSARTAQFLESPSQYGTRMQYWSSQLQQAQQVSQQEDLYTEGEFENFEQSGSRIAENNFQQEQLEQYSPLSPNTDNHLATQNFDHTLSSRQIPEASYQNQEATNQHTQYQNSSRQYGVQQSYHQGAQTQQSPSLLIQYNEGCGQSAPASYRDDSSQNTNPPGSPENSMPPPSRCVTADNIPNPYYPTPILTSANHFVPVPSAPIPNFTPNIATQGDAPAPTFRPALINGVYVSPFHHTPSVPIGQGPVPFSVPPPQGWGTLSPPPSFPLPTGILYVPLGSTPSTLAELSVSGQQISSGEVSATGYPVYYYPY